MEDNALLARVPSALRWLRYALIQLSRSAQYSNSAFSIFHSAWFLFQVLKKLLPPSPND